MACLRTAGREESKDLFGALKGTLDFVVDTGFGESLESKYETCCKHESPEVELALCPLKRELVSYFMMHMLLSSRPASRASTQVCARNVAASRHASAIGDCWSFCFCCNVSVEINTGRVASITAK